MRVRRVVKVVILMVMMMVMMGCNSGGVSEGKVNLEAKNSFLESLVKIGEGFQDIFGVFGSAFGDVLGFSVVKSGDKRSKVGEHFENLGKGLKSTMDKLNELKVEISKAKNADGSTIKIVEDAIQGANEVFEQLIDNLSKLAGVTNDSSLLGDTAVNSNAAGAEEASVNAIIERVKAIVEVAKRSGIEIKSGNAGAEVAGGGATAPASLVGKANSAVPDANSGPKLADEVSKADPWAMIDKIKNTKAKTGNVAASNANETGALAAGTGVDNAGAKSNADLAAAVALKAITKGGKLSAAANEDGAVKAAAVSATNKILGVLNVIIGETVSSSLDKIREAVKGIKYFGTDKTEAGQSDATQSVVAK
ncbi:variable large family protein [Borrelia duttonii]